VFGRSRPATGFSTDLKTLDALSAQTHQTPAEKVFAPAGGDESLYKKLTELRNSGVCVVEQLPGQTGDANSMLCTKVLNKKKGEWVLVDVE